MPVLAACRNQCLVDTMAIPSLQAARLPDPSPEQSSGS